MERCKEEERTERNQQDRRDAMEREEHTLDTLKVVIERAERKKGIYQGRGRQRESKGMESRVSMTREGARSEQGAGEKERRERNQQNIREAIERDDERILDTLRAAMEMADRKGVSFYSEKDRERQAQHGEHKTKLIRDTARHKSER
jgi:hypothetical protein